MRPDALVQARLGVGGVVPLVVPLAPIPDQVHHDVVVEFRPVRHRQAHRGEAGGGIVGVHAQDRDVVALRQIRSVAGGASLLRVGGEADLVVDDQMDHPARRVSRQPGEVDGLRHHTLGSEGGIAVDKEGHHRGRVLPVILPGTRELARPGQPRHHRVDELQVARVGGQRDPHRASVAQDVVAGGAVMVLHVPDPALVVGQREDAVRGRGRALELAQDLVVADAHAVREHVEPAPVGHPHHDFPAPPSRRHLEHQINHGHEHVVALEGKPHRPRIDPVQELFETFHVGEAGQQLDLLFPDRRLRVGARFHLVPEPAHALRRLQVLELVSDGPAPGALQPFQVVRYAFIAVVTEDRGGRERLQLLHAGADEGGIELRVSRGIAPQRVDAGQLVPVVAEGLHERRGPGDEMEEFPHRAQGGTALRGWRGWRGGAGGRVHRGGRLGAAARPPGCLGGTGGLGRSGWR